MLEPMTKADHRAALALVERAWSALYDISAGHVPICSMLERSFRRSELDHRRTNQGAAYACTVGQSTRQQSMRWLAHYLYAAELPGARDYLHIRQDVFLAAACVADVGEKISAAWEAAGIDSWAVSHLDYARLVQTPTDEGDTAP